MKTRRELEKLAKFSVEFDNYQGDMTEDEQYHHRRGFIIGYQRCEEELQKEYEEIIAKLEYGVNAFEMNKSQYPRIKTQDVIDLMKRIIEKLNQET